MSEAPSSLEFGAPMPDWDSDERTTIGPAPTWLLDILVDAVVVFDADWRFTWMNARAEQLLGRPRQELVGRVVWEEFPELEGTHFGASYRRAMAEGQGTHVEGWYAPLRAWFEVCAVPREGHLTLIFRDVTARRQAEEEHARSASRLALLQEMTGKLSAAASAEEVVDVLMRSGVAALEAMGATVALPAPDGRTLRMLYTESIPRELAREKEYLPIDMDMPLMWAFRSGEAEWLESPADFEARYPHLSETIQSLGSRALVCMPLRAKDTLLGGLALAFSEPRSFSEEDRALMMAVAHQAALALDRARLFDREQAARAEAEAQRARLHALVMQAPAVVALMRGPEHVFELVNARHSALHGGRDVTGFPACEALPSLVSLGLREILDGVYTTGETFSAREFPVRADLRGDGVVEERYFDFTYEPLRDSAGRVEGVSFFGFELTEQVRARRELEALARRLRFLSEASTLLAGSLDYSSTLESLARLVVPEMADWCSVEMLTADGRAERLAVAHQDSSREELAWKFVRLHPVDLSAPAGVGRVLRTGESEWQADIPEEALAAGVRDPEALRLARMLGVRSFLCVPLVARGRVLGSLTLAQAESGRRYTETDVRQAEELARRAALCVDNARLYQEAQNAIRLRDEFLSVASHELRTPLTSLRLQLSLLDRRLSEESRVLLKPKLEVTRRQVERLTSLVNTLLDVSRIVAGRITLELTEVDLVHVVQEALERLCEVFEQAGCAVTLQADGPVVGCWDAPRLDQVIVNLLTNAAKYGQGRPITVTVEGSEERALLIVRDEGIGIAEEDQQRLFGRFERAVSGRHYGGLGLGLYISREIVEALGGRVGVESRPGEGSTFRVELPRAQPASVP
jgi:PAS domain S-box-containing protein